MTSVTRNVQPGLVALGLALVVVGGVVLLLLGWQTVTADPAAIGNAMPAEAAVSDPPSRIWAIAAGLLMACGGAAVGIGLNRWFTYRK
jgi:hypothetical protein